nr:LINE-type retrotransposon LIb DNA [Ipomoea batatas]
MSIDGNTVYVSFGYARPNPVAKEGFWRSCHVYAEAVCDPWIFLGDFNDIAIEVEQWGSERVNSGNINRFMVAFNFCGLMDLSLDGANYSWVRQVGGSVVDSTSTRQTPLWETRPFRFEATWLMRDDYRAIWKDACANNGGVILKAIGVVTMRSKA